MRILYLAGTDGAGKTSVARLVANRAPTNVLAWPVRYCYAQHRPIVLWPFKVLAQCLFLRGKSPGRDYKEYSLAKADTRARRRWLATAYAGIWVFDYLIATQCLLLQYRFRRQVVIVDRYYPDIAINLSHTMGLSLRQTLRLISGFERVLPKPERTVWLDVSPSVAYSRKSDIPSEDYIREKREWYMQLAGPLRMVQLEADQPLETVTASVRDVILDLLAK